MADSVSAEEVSCVGLGLFRHSLIRIKGTCNAERAVFRSLDR